MEGRLIQIGRAGHGAAKTSPNRNAQLGITLMIIATVFFSFQDGVTKTLIQHYSIWELVFVRFCVLLVVVTLAATLTGGLKAMVRSGSKGLHLLRGVILIGEIVLVGQAYRYLGLAEVMTIFHLFPVIGVVMAVVFLKEKLALTTIVSLLLGLVGLAVAMAPANDLNVQGLACALGAAFFYATYIVLTRFASVCDGPATSIFYICLVGMLVPAVLFFGTFKPIQPEHFGLFGMLCAFNIVAQSSVVVALSFARASLLQPINYLQIVWTGLIGFWIFADTLTFNTILGGVLIAGAGMILVVSNARREIT